jgi:phosphatidylethanolamine/phosphatidyl-N-methylethanolamine N-methyltransferase
MKDHLLLLTQFLRSPRTIASVTPSSKALVTALLKEAKVSEADSVVEIGTGTGVMTEQIYKSLPKGGAFLAVERNSKLAAATRRKCPDVEVVQTDAVKLPMLLAIRDIGGCDSIASGVPWSTLLPREQDDLLEAIHDSLNEGGRFATFVYLHGLGLPSFWNFQRKLKHKFNRTGRSKLIWGNIPPAVVLWGEK